MDRKSGTKLRQTLNTMYDLAVKKELTKTNEGPMYKDERPVHTKSEANIFPFNITKGFSMPLKTPKFLSR